MPEQVFGSQRPESTLKNADPEFNLNSRSHGQIRDGKQAHPDVAEIDAKSIHVGRSGEYLHGGVQQLAVPATPVWFGVASENHPVHQ